MSFSDWNLKWGTNALVCSEPAEQWGAPAPIGANYRNVNVQRHSKAPAWFDWCAGLSYKTNHLLFDSDDKPTWLSITLALLYIQINFTPRPERIKPLWDIFPLHLHRIFASRAGRRPPRVVCARKWRHIATAWPSEDKLAGSSCFSHHGSESYRWMTKTYSRMSGSGDPDG